jgi:serine phosphatase RsbU (regulator of sigma subunit)
VLYTDGVTDTRGADGRYGTERLEALLEELGPVDVETIAGGIETALEAFGEQRDDVAVLVLGATADDAAQAAMLSTSGSAEVA